MNLIGKWHIFEMEMWGEDYFNMEVQAYIEIKSDGYSKFQFGLVEGDMTLESANDSNTEMNFDWDGMAENDGASGTLWVELKEDDIMKGQFEFDEMGDDSEFTARRVKE